MCVHLLSDYRATPSFVVACAVHSRFGVPLVLPTQQPPIFRPRMSEGIARSTPWSPSLAVDSAMQFGWNYIGGAGRVVRFVEV